MASSCVRPTNGASATDPSARLNAEAAIEPKRSLLSASRPDHRRDGSRHINPMQIELRSDGTSARSSEGGVGSLSLLLRITSISGPLNATSPVSASYSVAPTPYQSLASDGGMPEPVSGET